MEFTIIGKIPAKKNTLRRGKGGNFYNSARRDMDPLVLQIKAQMGRMSASTIKSDCRLSCCVYDDDRSDLNNAVTTICDLLEEAGAVKNDRLIKQIEAQKVIDGKNPRVELQLTEFRPI